MDKNTDKGYLEKSYRHLILWFVSLFSFAILYGVVISKFDLKLNSKVINLIWMNVVNLFLVSLFVMIYKTEKIYYINYVTYKEAYEASSEERRAFAYKHLTVFSIAAIIYLAYSTISTVFTYSRTLDIGVFLVIIIVSALRTISIRFKKE